MKSDVHGYNLLPGLVIAMLGTRELMQNADHALQGASKFRWSSGDRAGDPTENMSQVKRDPDFF